MSSKYSSLSALFDVLLFFFLMLMDKRHALATLRRTGCISLWYGMDVEFRIPFDHNVTGVDNLLSMEDLIENVSWARGLQLICIF